MQKSEISKGLVMQNCRRRHFLSQMSHGESHRSFFELLLFEKCALKYAAPLTVLGDVKKAGG